MGSGSSDLEPGGRLPYVIYPELARVADAPVSATRFVVGAQLWW